MADTVHKKFAMHITVALASHESVSDVMDAIVMGGDHIIDWDIVAEFDDTEDATHE